jgi:hypothetical protein
MNRRRIDAAQVTAVNACFAEVDLFRMTVTTKQARTDANHYTIIDANEQ